MNVFHRLAFIWIGYTLRFPCCKNRYYRSTFSFLPAFHSILTKTETWKMEVRSFCLQLKYSLNPFSIHSCMPVYLGKEIRQIQYNTNCSYSKSKIRHGSDRQPWRKLKRTEIVDFWKLVSLTVFFKVHFCCLLRLISCLGSVFVGQETWIFSFRTE